MHHNYLARIQSVEHQDAFYIYQQTEVERQKIKARYAESVLFALRDLVNECYSIGGRNKIDTALALVMQCLEGIHWANNNGQTAIKRKMGCHTGFEKLLQTIVQNLLSSENFTPGEQRELREKINLIITSKLAEASGNKEALEKIKNIQSRVWPDIEKAIYPENTVANIR